MLAIRWSGENLNHSCVAGAHLEERELRAHTGVAQLDELVPVHALHQEDFEPVQLARLLPVFDEQKPGGSPEDLGAD